LMWRNANYCLPYKPSKLLRLLRATNSFNSTEWDVVDLDGLE
jgi:hypothetical protein